VPPRKALLVGRPVEPGIQTILSDHTGQCTQTATRN
jgi:hypothetical protein